MRRIVGIPTLVLYVCCFHFHFLTYAIRCHLVLLPVRPAHPGPRDAVPETGTPSPIGTTFVFFYDQGTVGEVTTLAKYFLLTFQHENNLAPRSSGEKRALPASRETCAGRALLRRGGRGCGVRLARRVAAGGAG